MRKVFLYLLFTSLLFAAPSPLHEAVFEADEERVDGLLSRGADVDLANDDEISPLHQATFTGRNKIVAFLLKTGADPYSVNEDGQTLYDFAIAKKNMAAVSTLRDHMKGKR